jgi:hypothetical protein
MLALFYFAISFLLATLCYNSRINTKNFLSKTSSVREVSNLVVRTLLLIGISFFTEQWVIILILLFSSMLMIYFNVKKRVYYDRTIEYAFKSGNFIFLWSAIVLVALKITASSAFYGGVIVWLVGLPFVVGAGLAIIRFYQGGKTTSDKKLESAEDLVDHLASVLMLMRRQAKSYEVDFLVSEYIQSHLSSCPEEDCPLKMIKQSNAVNVRESLLRVIERAFHEGIAKFKASVRLRISFVMFLTDNIGSYKQSLEQLMIVSNLKLSFYEAFLVYYWKRVIQQKLKFRNSSGAKEAADLTMVDLAKFNSEVKEFTRDLTELLKTQNGLWKSVLENNTPIENIDQFSQKINELIDRVKEEWTVIEAHSERCMSAAKLYLTFLKRMINDPIAYAAIKSNYDRLTSRLLDRTKNDFSNLNKLSSNLALSVVKFNPKSPGRFDFVNSEFCSLFGSLKEALVGQSLEVIMPDMYTAFLPGFSRTIQSRILIRFCLERELLRKRSSLFREARHAVRLPYHFQCHSLLGVEHRLSRVHFY